jgi:hypothetical protein
MTAAHSRPDAATLEVVSVSLGSSRRDHTVEVSAANRDFRLSRVGTDGDLEAAAERIGRLDGQVAAIGLGGIDIYLEAAGTRYEVRDGVRLRDCARTTPVVDGSGVKATLERRAVESLVAEGAVTAGTPVLLVSALDRFGMAEAFAAAGCALRCGDLMFTAGIPYLIESLEELADLARRVLPQVSKLPFGMLYPTGGEQDKEPDARFAAAYEEAEVVAGDFHFIRRHMPKRLDGKTVVTNTTTAQDVADLRARGVRRLVTTTPDMAGRSFGTNVMEAMAMAYLGTGRQGLSRGELESTLARLGIRPESRLLAEVGA